MPKFKKQINEILDANKDLVFTQEQYNILLDLAYQGGSGAVTRLIELSKNETEALTHIESIRTKYAKAYGKDEAETKFGEAFMTKFKEAKNVYEKNGSTSSNHESYCWGYCTQRPIRHGS